MRAYLSFFLFLFLALTAGLKAQASTPSALIAELNQSFGKLEGFPPIFILDRDELETRFVLGGASLAPGGEKTKDLAKVRRRILKDYVAEMTGEEMNSNDVVNLENLYSVSRGASAYQWHRKPFDSNTPVYLCTVLPPSYDFNEAQVNAHILQLENKEIYPEHNFSHIKDPMGREEAQLFSILHEVGHCLDQEYMPKMLGREPGPSSVHTAESYAEVIGGLLMAQRGYIDILQRRAKFRMTYSWNLAPYFHAHPELGMGSPLAISGGTIYALHKSLWGLDNWLKSSPEAQNLQELSPAELAEVAVELVNKHAYETPQFSAINNYFAEKDKEAYFKRYRDWAKNTPDPFVSAIAELEAYLKLAPKITAALLADEPVREDFSSSTVSLHLDFKSILTRTITDCKTREDQTRSFMKGMNKKLRAALYSYSGYDVSPIMNKLAELPFMAQGRLEELGCNH